MFSRAEEQKETLRRHLRDRGRLLAPAERERASAEACRRLMEQPEWQSARSVLFYSPLADELDLLPTLLAAVARGTTAALPRFVPTTGLYEAAVVQDPDSELARGRFGIWEPQPSCRAVALKRLDLALVPGLGFDPAGRRLGRGKGYYDRLLPSVGGVLCGVAMDWQVLSGLPGEPHDQTLDCILTPTRWLACRSRAV